MNYLLGRLSSLFLSIIISVSAMGFESVYLQIQNDTQNFHIVQKEEALWRYFHFEKKPGELQVLLSKKAYSTKKNAQAARQSVLKAAVFTELKSFESRFLTEVNDSYIWRHEAQWSEAKEKDYSDWVKENATEGFLAEHGVATDCADVAFSYRWIFARINKLPVANQLAGSRTLFTNYSMKRDWANLPTAEVWHEDQRFMKALNYLLRNTYTHSLIRDSYPVKIAEGSFVPGVYFLNLFGVSGHTQLVSEVNYNDVAQIPLYVVESTVPREVRILSKNALLDFNQATSSSGGFLSFRWPQGEGRSLRLASRESMPGFSTEQYSPEFMNEGEEFSRVVLRRVSPDFSILLMIKTMMDGIKDLFRQRISIVQEGFSICAPDRCAEGTNDYENWSTPSRDGRLRSALSTAEKTVAEIYYEEPEVAAYWLATLDEAFLNVEEHTWSLKELRFVWQSETYSFEPWHSVTRRWGLKPASLTELMTEKFRAGFMARSQLIERSSASFTVDNHMKFISHIAREYCAVFSAEHCQEINEQLGQMRLAYYDKNLSLQEWMGQLDWFLSGANDSAESRWGVKKENASYNTLVNTKSFASGVHLTAVGTNEETTVYSSQTKEAIAVTSNSKISFHENSEWTAQLNSTMQVYDIKSALTGQTYTVPVTSEITESEMQPLWLKENWVYLPVAAPYSYKLFRLSYDGLAEIETRSMAMPRIDQGVLSSYVVERRSLDVLRVINNRLSQQAYFLSEAMEDISEARVEAVSDSHFLVMIIGNGCENGFCYYANRYYSVNQMATSIDMRVLSEVSELRFLSPMTVYVNFYDADSDSEVSRVVLFGADFLNNQVLLEKKDVWCHECTRDYGDDEFNPYFSLRKYGDVFGQYFYLTSESELLEYLIPQGEKMTWGQRNLVATMGGDQIMRLRDFATQEILASGKYLHPISDTTSTKWVGISDDLTGLNLGIYRIQGASFEKFFDGRTAMQMISIREPGLIRWPIIEEINLETLSMDLFDSDDGTFKFKYKSEMLLSPHTDISYWME